MKQQCARRNISAHKTVWVIRSILDQPVNIHKSGFMNM